MSCKNTTFRFAGTLWNSLANGEGCRDVIFFSGCTRNCKGCHNKDMQSFDFGKEEDIDYISHRVIMHHERGIIDGVTLSGGDPLFQPDALIRFCEIFKKNGINIWLYTGATIDTIDDKILELVNVVVDGEYIEELKVEDGHTRYIGSSNQIIHRLR
ncbi:MAG: 4Fe-4S single cluster domain-containing protein [Anaerovoracaceae bacterium]